jgi:hypothetical protein
MDLSKLKYLYFKNPGRKKYFISSFTRYNGVVRLSANGGITFTIPEHLVKYWFDPPTLAEQILYDGQKR